MPTLARQEQPPVQDNNAAASPDFDGKRRGVLSVENAAGTGAVQVGKLPAQSDPSVTNPAPAEASARSLARLDQGEVERLTPPRTSGPQTGAVARFLRFAVIPFHFMNLTLKAFGLRRKNRPASTAAVPSSPAPAPSASEAPVSEPARAVTPSPVSASAVPAGAKPLDPPVRQKTIQPGPEGCAKTAPVRTGATPLEGRGAPPAAASAPPALPRHAESQTTLRKAHDELRQQCQTISAEADKQRDALTEKEQERMDLMARVFNAEVELDRSRAALEREREERRLIEQERLDLTVAKADLEMQLSTQGRSKKDPAKSSGSTPPASENATVTDPRIQPAARRPPLHPRRMWPRSGRNATNFARNWRSKRPNDVAWKANGKSTPIR